MSFINWGHESPEQLEARRRLEAEYATLFEQAVRASRNQGQSPFGGAGGSKKTESQPIQSPTVGSAILLAYVNESDLWSMVVINFDAGTVSTPIDTGIQYSGGNSYIVSRYNSVHNEGFMIIFYNDALSRVECFFVSAGGEVIDTISTFGGYDYGTLDYVGAWFADYEPDGEPTTEIIFKMFDGINVTTHTLSDTSGISIGSYAGSLLGEHGAIATLTRTNDEIEVYLLRWDGTQDLIISHEVGTNYTMLCQNTSDFLVVFDQADSGSYYFSRIRKWTGSRLDLEETLLDEGQDVNEFSYVGMYGTSKLIAVLSNNSTSAVDYLTYQTSVSGTNLETHVRSKNYPDVDVYVTDRFIGYPANVINEKAVVTFSQKSSGSSLPTFDTYTYYDIQYFTEAGVKYEHTLAFNATVGIGFSNVDAGRGSVYAKDPIFYIVSKTNSLEFTVLGGSGISSFSTVIPDDLDQLEVLAVSPEYFLVRYVENSDLATTIWKIYDSTEELESITTSDTLEYDSSPVNLDGIVVIDTIDVMNSFAWSGSTGLVGLNDLTQGSVYSVLGFESVRYDFGTLTAFPPGYQVVLETKDGDTAPTLFFIFSSGSGWQGPFTTGLTGNENVIDVQLGESVLHYLWDNGSRVTVDLYSLLTGQRIVRYDTGYHSDDLIGYDEYGDRSVSLFDTGESYLHVFPTKTGEVKTITVPQTSVLRAYNDAYWSAD